MTLTTFFMFQGRGVQWR